MYGIDGGANFGLWDDSVSRLMYFDCMEWFLSGVDITGVVGDFGGGNGNLKRFIPNSISVDTDESKSPDILGSVLTHQGNYDLVVIRYLLHYLPPNDRKQLFANLALNNIKQLLVIQFTNDGEDLKIKLNNSINEKKWFMTLRELDKLMHNGLYHVTGYKKQNYMVTSEFYKNRLNNPSAKKHGETVSCYQLEKI